MTVSAAIALTMTHTSVAIPYSGFAYNVGATIYQAPVGAKTLISLDSLDDPGTAAGVNLTIGFQKKSVSTGTFYTMFTFIMHAVNANLAGTVNYLQADKSSLQNLIDYGRLQHRFVLNTGVTPAPSMPPAFGNAPILMYPDEKLVVAAGNSFNSAGSSNLNFVLEQYSSQA